MSQAAKKLKASSSRAQASNTNGKLMTNGDKGEDVGLLETFTKAIDDIRSLVACRICTRPIGCLTTDGKKLVLDAVREYLNNQYQIIRQIKNLVQVIIGHPALLEDGDTIEKLREDQNEEAVLVEKDRSSDPGRDGGLFKGCFKYTPHVSIFDNSDGVYRCPSCNWELEGGYCLHCERTFEDDLDSDAGLSLSDGDDTAGEDMDHEQRHSERSGPDYGPEDDDLSSTSTEELVRRHFPHPAALSRNGRAASGDRTRTVDVWPESDSEFEEYETPPNSIPHGPITWANHPNFARVEPTSSSEDEYDPEMDDFIDDNSLGLGSANAELSAEDYMTDNEDSNGDDASEEGMVMMGEGIEREQNDDEEGEDLDGHSSSLSNDSVVVNSRAHLQDPAEDNEEDFEISQPSSISTQGTDSLTGDCVVKMGDHQSTSSSESISYTPTRQQQRKRRRMVVMDESDEEDKELSFRETPARRRRRFGVSDSTMSSQSSLFDGALIPRGARRFRAAIDAAGGPAIHVEPEDLTISDMPPQESLGHISAGTRHNGKRFRTSGRSPSFPPIHYVSNSPAGRTRRNTTSFDDGLIPELRSLLP